MALYVQYGCGLSAPEGWLNYDASPTLRMQKIPVVGGAAPGPKFPRNARYGDIVKGLPLPDGSADAVYCSHTLEHLSLQDCEQALKNTFRLLRADGVFRFVLPDLKLLAQEYIASNAPDAAVTFMKETLLGEEVRPRGVSGLLRAWIGNSDHRWMWDYESLTQLLSAAGFQDIRRATLGDSGDPMFAEVEDPNRWTRALGMQCVRRN